VEPTAGLERVEKKKFLTLQGLELRPHRRPACSLSLYRLRYRWVLDWVIVIIDRVYTQLVTKVTQRYR
jgi:hypothetical protein